MVALTDAELDAAMAVCAQEPAHIPGSVQPFARFLAFEPETRTISYVSENSDALFDMPAKDVLGRDLRDLLGSELWHEIAGAMSAARSSNVPSSVGLHKIGETEFEMAVVVCGDLFGVEFESPSSNALQDLDMLKTLRFMTRQVQDCTSADTLFRVTTETLRQITGYDRVTVYRFDSEFNGEILAESRTGSMDSILGLRFPHWDIPAQARELMKAIPLRIIQDAEQTPVPILARDGQMPPIDLTFAAGRGVSAVHMEYLRNSDLAATMTLTVMLGDTLWGIISFHHRRPRIPALRLREVLISFTELFSTKLEVLQQDARLQMIQRVDEFGADAAQRIDDDLEIEVAMQPVFGLVSDVLSASSIALLDGSRTVAHGPVPGQAALAAIRQEVFKLPVGEVFLSEQLSKDFPAQKEDLHDLAGLLAVKFGTDRILCIFRRERAQEVNWAGNPEKKIETVDGRTRLAPRGSFSTYLEQVRGRAEPWSDEELYVAKKVQSIVNSAERRMLMNTINRQQTLMVNELHHRVRNILALVRSVSSQARRRYGSLNSYAKALETRIQALATAHDLASGKMVRSVGLHQLINKELEPYAQDTEILVTGIDRNIRPALAPIFALVIHELVTNATKYGALSVPNGSVLVDLHEDADGLRVTWQEKGGPKVVQPEERGFGTVLIAQAIPHEMGGEVDLSFEEDGVRATLFIPDNVFEFEDQPQDPLDAQLNETEPEGDVTLEHTTEAIMIVEDNFIIANELREQLLDLGATSVETFSNLPDALDFLEGSRPAFALLDINLGNNETSAPIAEKLQEMGVRFGFISGYGEADVLPPALSHIHRMSKPLSSSDLNRFLLSVV